MKKKIGILDFKNSNTKSIYTAIKKINFEPELISEKKELKKYSNLVLPGVGTFKSAMKYLKDNDLSESLKNFYEEKNKILAICLGMQILLDTGFEFGRQKGLGIIQGEVKRIPENKIHLGWNLIKFKKSKNKNFFAYFVHSYYTEISDKDLILTETKINNFKFTSSFKKDNLLGCQFHPEKSGQAGLDLIKNFFINDRA